jgi:ADP-heptose:LPS heptosyltransferase
MNVNAMRAIDRFAGVPLCWLTGMCHRLFNHTSHHDGIGEGPIVVMKFFGMGSVLLSSPLLDALRDRFPDRTILFVTFAANREVLDRLPQPSVRLTIDSSSPRRFLRDAIRTLGALRRSRPAMVFDLEFFSKFSTLCSALSGAAFRVGFALPTRWRRWNLTHPAALGHGVHVTELFLRQLDALGMPAARRFPVTHLASAEPDRTGVQAVIPPAWGEAQVVAVNINAGRTSLERRWPPDRFIQVVRALSAAGPQRRFTFIGSEDERSYVASALAAAPDLAERVANCAGQLTLGGLIALLERSALLVTNDSGPMHVASAVGTPVVALFGPESPSLYAPSGKVVIIDKHAPCSPCLTVYNAKQFVCPFDARCMKEIAVAEVVAAASSFLSPARTGVA